MNININAINNNVNFRVMEEEVVGETWDGKLQMRFKVSVFTSDQKLLASGNNTNLRS